MAEIGEISSEREAFFADLEAQHLAVTYDDVRVRTRSGSGAPLPEILDMSSQFSTNVGIKVPFVSAAMTSVTESDMAISMAKAGGIGVIHGAMSIEKQRKEVRRVKMAVNSLIQEPRCAEETETLESVLNRCAQKNYPFRTFPVIDTNGKFVGVLTDDDFKYPESMKVQVGEAMTPAQRVTDAAVGTSQDEAYRLMQENKISTLPLLDEDRVVSGLYLWSDVSRIRREGATYNVDSAGQLLVAAAVSTRGDFLERVAELEKYADVLVIDSADGDSYHAFKALESIKERSDLDVVVGNISEGDSAFELAEAKADGIKVGQGPGAICTTRDEMGIGIPQVTAVYNCVKALRDKYPHVPVCADGGIKAHGDTSIALGAGAHSVMMGKMLAGTKEAPGPILQRPDGSMYKLYWGMGSARELRESAASRERYDAIDGKMPVPEGIESKVPYEGELRDVLGVCIQALEKSMRYVKSPDITAHREHTRFERITNAGLHESHPHDVEVIPQ